MKIYLEYPKDDRAEEEDGNLENPEGVQVAQVKRLKRCPEYPEDDRAAQVEEIGEGQKTLKE